MIRRREFITLLAGGAAAWPSTARTQNRDAVRRIGVLGPSSADDADYQARHRAFLQELQKLGWTIGHNLQMDYRYGAGDAARIRGMAA
jgi:putative ABC transport system substrate-binding protein